MKHRETAYALLRITLGVIFLFYLHYALVNFVLLWLVDLNRFSLDSSFRRTAAAEFAS